MVRALRRRREVGRNDRPGPLSGSVTRPSEIPCRVIELPGAEATLHEEPAHNGEAHTGRLGIKDEAMDGG